MVKKLRHFGLFTDKDKRICGFLRLVFKAKICIIRSFFKALIVIIIQFFIIGY